MSMAKMNGVANYKYMSFDEEADFNRKVMDLLDNKKYKEIQIYEEKGFTETIGEGEKVYIIEIYEKNKPELDDIGYTKAVAIMGHKEVQKFEKSLEIEKKVEIVWLDST
ncbi:MAG: hypothetical protein ABFC12_00390 [Methanobacterium sp.]